MNQRLHPDPNQVMQTNDLSLPLLRPTEAVDKFCETISKPENLSNDYGDWMRKVNHELIELGDSLVGTSPTVQAHLLKMHDYIQLEPDFKIMQTLRRALTEALAIREELGGGNEKTLADYGVSLTDSDPAFVTH